METEKHRASRRARAAARRVVHVKTCPICLTSFETPYSRAKYCSDNCYVAGQKPLHKKVVRKKAGLKAVGVLTRQCIVCSSEFERANPNQKRCATCIAHPELQAPLCACGCGEKTSWQPTIGYAQFCPSHNLRKAGFGVTRFVERACVTCGQPFVPTQNGRKHCSRGCYAASRTGHGHKRFKGGRTKYAALLDPYTNKYRRAHRVIMQEIIGRQLKWHEVIHHIDEDGLNNSMDDEKSGRPENLHLFHCDRCHQYHHATDASLLYRYKEAHVKNGIVIGLPKRKPNQLGK